MKKVLLIIMALAVAMAADAKPKQPKELNLRIGTYNVWSHSARKSQIRKGRATEDRNWNNSKQAVAKLITKLNCDIIGMQEVTTICRDDLMELVKGAKGKKYTLWWVDSYPNSTKKNVGNGVFYDRKRYKFEQQEIHYFSPTPDKPTSGWDEKRFIRSALTAVVTHKKSGRKFFFIATHGPLGDIANGHAGRLIVEFEQEFNTEKLPVIVVGDMNADPEMEFYKRMCQHFEDCFVVAKDKCGNIGTFNSAQETDTNFKKSSRRIDHIYVRSTEKGRIEVKNYTVNRDKLQCGNGLHYPSDHNPVYVDLTIK